MGFVDQKNALHCFTEHGTGNRHIVIDAVSMNEVYNEQISDPHHYFESNDANLIYIPSKDLLMCIGAYDWSAIASLDFNEAKKDWKLIGELPFVVTDGGRTHNSLLYDDIIIVLETWDAEIWCLDTKEFPLCEWYKSDLALPISKRTADRLWCCKDKNDIVHLLQLNLFNHEDDDINEEFTAPIQMLVSKELRAERKEKYLPLALGYLREQETKTLDRQIPFALKCLISTYCIFY